MVFPSTKEAITRESIERLRKAARSSWVAFNQAEETKFRKRIEAARAKDTLAKENRKNSRILSSRTSTNSVLKYGQSTLPMLVEISRYKLTLLEPSFKNISMGFEYVWATYKRESPSVPSPTTHGPLTAIVTFDTKTVSIPLI